LKQWKLLDPMVLVTVHLVLKMRRPDGSLMSMDHILFLMLVDVDTVDIHRLIGYFKKI